MTDLQTQAADWKARIETALDHWLPDASLLPQRLHAAMRYAAVGGGKRIRPLLVYATGKSLDIPEEKLDGMAVAIELIHAYSLVHDDLPAMDNDDLRRGRPTCHRAYDEATAILAGDALQTLAFQVLTHDENLTSHSLDRLAILRILADASGSHGMVGGQAIDLDAVGKELTIAELENMHIHKTGALIRASVLMASHGRPDVSDITREHLDRYAQCIGLAFQIRDDILDIESDTETLGKPQGSDEVNQKPTFPSLLGLEEAKAHARNLYDEALEALSHLPFEKTDALRWIAEFIVTRIN